MIPYFPFVEAAVMAAEKKAVIKSISITQNGEYYAPLGVDGYNPVYVSVPDRYDEGFKDGYDEGYKDGREAQKKICDEEKAVLIEEIARQDKEIEDLKNNQGYTFPDGTAYEDIYSFVGGAGTITDSTLGRYIKTDVTDLGDNGTEVVVGIYSSDGTLLTTIGGGGYGPSIQNVKVDSILVTASTGAYDIAISYDSYVGSELKHLTTHQTGTAYMLKNFGSADHTIAVTNK